MVELPPEDGVVLPLNPHRSRTAREIEDSVKSQPVPQRAYMQYEGSFVYTIALRCPKAGVSGMIIVLHKEKFSEEQLKEKLKVVEERVHEMRVEKRRTNLISTGPKIPNYQEYNEECFQEDVDFFEAVLMDSFDFRKLMFFGAEAQIEPVVNGIYK